MLEAIAGSTAHRGIAMRAGFLRLLAFAALLGCNTVASAQNQHIALDGNLAEGQSVTNTIRIVGWAITPQSSGHVEVLVDDSPAGKAAYPLSRQDVPDSGFALELDTTAHANGVHTISARSLSPTGTPIASASRTLRFANVPARGAIDAPRFRDPAAGVIGVSGWALAEGGFGLLEVQVDGRFAASADWGAARPDVQAAFPEYGIANAGFHATLDLATLGLARGYHRITVVGIDGTGTRRAVAESEFFYTVGRAGSSHLDLPAQGASLATGGSLRVAGWTEGDVPARQVEVFVNDRLAGVITDMGVPRPDVTAAFPQARNVRGFDATIPSLGLGLGRHRITAVVTDSRGLRANMDVFTGPLYFDVVASERVYGAHLRPQNDYAATIAAYTRAVAAAPGIVMYFQPWRVASGNCSPFDAYPYLPEAVRSAGALPLITWEPLQEGSGSAQHAFSYDRILAGAHDECIAQFARDVRGFRTPVLIRLAHEMNGNSNSWTGIANGNNPPGYVAVFRKVVDMFRAEGASNARFVWSPDHASPPEVPQPASEIRNYYPGDGYVDFIGVSGYNWGNDPLRGGGWVSAEQLFSNFLGAMSRDAPGKPVLITEIGSVPGYADFSRADWYREAFAFFSSRKDLKGVVWFNDFAFADSSLPDFRYTGTPGLAPVSAAETAVMKELIQGYQRPATTGP